jgi:MoxR-like ATPase
MKRPFNPREQAAGPRPASVRPYQTTAELELAVNIALVCDRPLLLMGASGTGKSTLARFVAWCLRRHYAEHVITSRTSADDLKWRFDAVRRLQAAQMPRALRTDADELARQVQLGGEFDRQFVTPGVLWDAFDPEGARAIRDAAANAGAGVRDRAGRDEPDREHFGDDGVVVLLDEIDKADPDVPNDLLVTLDQRWFHCSDLDESVSAARDRKILVLITSNQERELPRAFTRRCIVAHLPRHSSEHRRAIAVLHRPGISEALLDRIDKVFMRLEAAATDASVPPPSTAEYLDAASACVGLELTEPEPGDAVDAARGAELDKALEAAIEATLWKHGPLPPRPEPRPDRPAEVAVS